jgi:hypothetical protein
MAKAQTDIRTTSYDEPNANAFGYQGTIEDALEQIKSSPSVPRFTRGYAREELLRYLGVKASYSNGPDVQLDADARYGFSDEPGVFTLEYARLRGWIKGPLS